MKPIGKLLRFGGPRSRARDLPDLARELDLGAIVPSSWSAWTRVGRRRFLQIAGGAIALLTAPVGRLRRAGAATSGTFFTPSERATLAALCDAILPPDHDPGASELGAPSYVEALLTAFDRSGVPRIFAGGPFSDRNPYPDYATGTPSHRFPQNSLKRFLGLSRLEAIEWRAQIFGSRAAGVPKFIDDQLGGALVGLRDLYRSGLATVDRVSLSAAGAPYTQLSPDERDRVFKLLDAGVFQPDPRRGGSTFIDVLIQHTLEGCFGLPEYGGNRDAQGWRMLGLEGDNQPLGFSVFSLAKGDYNERPDHPMTTPNPDEVGADGRLRPQPLTADGSAVASTIIQLTQALGEDCE